jgi:hypothetical protein
VFENIKSAKQTIKIPLLWESMLTKKSREEKSEFPATRTPHRTGV